MDFLAHRREKITAAIVERNLSALLVSNPIHVTYLTGFTGDSSYLLVLPQRLILISDDRFRVQIAEECPQLETVIRPHSKTTAQAVAETIHSLALRDVGVEARHLCLAEFEYLREQMPSVNLVPQSAMVETLRRIKDEGEIDAIRQAIRIAEKTYQAVTALMTEEDTEKEVATAIENYVRRLGGRGSAFTPIVAVGAHSALPHAPPGDLPLKTAPFLLLDWGAKGPTGYHSDLTRMLFSPAGGSWPRSERAQVENRLRKLYTTVREAQAKAISMLRPGVACRDVDRAARAVLEQAGLNSYFTHGLGHGLGLQIHEGPFLRENTTDVLEAHMIVTIEPGVYFPDFAGIRVEDDVWITPDGPQLLTSLPREWEDFWPSLPD